MGGGGGRVNHKWEGGGDQCQLLVSGSCLKVQFLHTTKRVFEICQGSRYLNIISCVKTNKQLKEIEMNILVKRCRQLVSGCKDKRTLGLLTADSCHLTT